MLSPVATGFPLSPCGDFGRLPSGSRQAGSFIPVTLSRRFWHMFLSIRSAAVHCLCLLHALQTSSSCLHFSSHALWASLDGFHGLLFMFTAPPLLSPMHLLHLCRLRVSALRRRTARRRGLYNRSCRRSWSSCLSFY